VYKRQGVYSYDGSDTAAKPQTSYRFTIENIGEHPHLSLLKTDHFTGDVYLWDSRSQRDDWVKIGEPTK
jgi:hypothetical protein